MRIILASASPRRKELLTAMGFRIDVIAPKVDETQQPNEEPEAMVLRLAKMKAETVKVTDPLPIVAADTAVVLGAEIFGKPDDDSHAKAILKRLSGREHRVLTGFAIKYGDQMISKVVSTRVSFRPLTPAEIDAYVVSKEPLGKAGAYAIQGKGSFLVDRIDGSLTNVIGLPIAEVAAALEALVARPS